MWPEKEIIATNGDPVDILVVGNNDSQCASIVLAPGNAMPDVLVAAVRDEEDTLDFLFGRGAWTDRVGQYRRGHNRASV